MHTQKSVHLLLKKADFKPVLSGCIVNLYQNQCTDEYRNNEIDAIRNR